MPISWVNSDGKVGVSEDAYMYIADKYGKGSDMEGPYIPEEQEQGKKSDRLELLPQERINQAFGEGPTPEVKDQNNPIYWGMKEEVQRRQDFMRTYKDTPESRGIIKENEDYEMNMLKPPVERQASTGFHEQLAAFQERLNNTPPAEASELQKFLGSLNIMPAPGKPQEEWTAKEHIGYMLNTAMAGVGGGFKAPPRGPTVPVPPKTMVTPLQAQLAKYEELSSQGKTTKQIVKGTKMEPEMVGEALGRDNLAIAAFNSENALTDAYFKQLETLDPKLGEALKKQVSIKDLKRFTRLLPEERLKGIFEQLPESVKQSFESGEQRRMNIDAGKKSKIIAKPLKD